MLNKWISKVTEDDKELFQSYVDASKCRFENSFEYIRLYFDNGIDVAFKYHHDESLIFFSKRGKKRLSHQIFKPLGENNIEALLALHSHLQGKSYGDVYVRDLPEDLIKGLKSHKNRRFEQYLYDLGDLDELKGNKWRNVRQKINRFKRANKGVKIKTLDESNSKDAVHLIGAWRKQGLQKRGFSYSDVKKNLFGARYYRDKVDEEEIWSYVYYIKNKPVSFQLLYRINKGSAAHSIGISDTSFDGLSEFAQIDSWRRLKDSGIRWINDGYSWSKDLIRYKEKFNPKGKENTYWCVPMYDTYQFSRQE
jgi:hypothetical protein